jgi:hypothetical protein
VSSSIKVTDKGWMSIKAIADAGTYEVTVSAPVFYAGYVEYGTVHMAARPFMHWMMDAAGNYVEPVAKIIKNVKLARDESGAKGMVASLVGELKGLAVKMVDDCRAQIIGDWIIDTGKMMRSISYSISVAGKPWMGGYLGMQEEQYKGLKGSGNTGKILKGIKARSAPRSRRA